MTSDDDTIDQALRRAFAPPPAEAFAERARAVARPGPARPWWPWVVALAATLLLAAVFVLRPGRELPAAHEALDGAPLGQLWAAAYEQALGCGDGGRSCCDPGLDFATACQRQLSQRLELGEQEGVQLIGCFCGPAAGGGVAALVRDGDEAVAVFVLPRRDDVAPHLPPGSPWLLERRELGDCVLYAVSQAPASRVLAQFTLPDQ